MTTKKSDIFDISCLFQDWVAVFSAIVGSFERKFGLAWKSLFATHNALTRGRFF